MSAFREVATGSQSRRLLYLLLAGLFAWVFAVPASFAEQVDLGINVLSLPGDAATLRERFRKVRALGISEVRLDWEWRKAEGTRGEYRWESFDTLVRTAHEAGVSLLPIVHYAPEWAIRVERKPAEGYELAPREDAFVDFARFLLESIRRYGPKGTSPVHFSPIRYWQVWNEPNTRQFWGPKPDPAAFARLMRQVQTTVEPARNLVQLVHAGLSKADVEFMWQLWAANPNHGETFDIFAVHPYVFDWNDGIRAPEAMDRGDSGAAALGFVGSIKDPGYLAKVFNLQLFMTLRGMSNKPIWITEMGYFVGRHRLGVSESEQAERLTKTVDFVSRRLTDQPFGPGARAVAARVQRLYWFSLEDYPSPDGLGSFGVYRPDGALRPAGEALRKYIH